MNVTLSKPAKCRYINGQKYLRLGTLVFMVDWMKSPTFILVDAITHRFFSPLQTKASMALLQIM